MKKMFAILLFICSISYGQVRIIKTQTTAGGQHKTLKVQSTGIIGQQSIVRLTKNAILIPVAFISQYQTVLDYATANGITTPSINQNIINNGIVNSLVQLGDWDSLDVFYYFKQETGTPYQFLTLNWHDPSKYRLTNGGANNVAFVADSGFKVTGGNSQYFNMNYTPSTDSVNFKATNNGIIYKIFGFDSVYSQQGRIFGGTSVASSRLSASNVASGQFTISSYQLSSGSINGTALSGFSQSKINGHYHISSLSDRKWYQDEYYIGDAFQYTLGSGSEDAPLCLFGNNYLGTKYPSEAPVGLSYFILGAALRKDSGRIYEILNPAPLPKLNPGTLAFTIAQTAGFPSLYYPKVYPSAPFKTYFSGITKNYIVTYSTDHGGEGATAVPGNGALGWGQCDDPMLSGYVDGGIIIAGYQSETPSLLLNPNDPNGQVIWLSYHPTHTFPDNNGIQQTRLLTTSGGTDLNHTTWTDRGRVLGLTATEQTYTPPHTGYADLYMENDGTITALHGVGITSAIYFLPKYARSTNPGNSYVFTRIDQDIDLTSYMPFHRLFHFGPALFFKRNGIQYAVARNNSWILETVRSDNHISIYRCDGNYHPISLLGNISGQNRGDNSTNSGFYIEGDILYIYYVKNYTSLYVTTWDLKNLD